MKHLLISGDNGLLFTYGVTGSGKTHTMQGTLEVSLFYFHSIMILKKTFIANKALK